jgi:hypothetical protein
MLLRWLIAAGLALAVAGPGYSAPPKAKPKPPAAATTKTVVLDITGFH